MKTIFSFQARGEPLWAPSPKRIAGKRLGLGSKLESNYL